MLCYFINLIFNEGILKESMDSVFIFYIVSHVGKSAVHNAVVLEVIHSVIIGVILFNIERYGALSIIVGPRSVYFVKEDAVSTVIYTHTEGVVGLYYKNIEVILTFHLPHSNKSLLVIHHVIFLDTAVEE